MAIATPRLYFKFFKISNNLDSINVKSSEVVVSYSGTQAFEGDLLNINIKRNIKNIIQGATISDLPYEGVYQYIAKYDRIEVWYDYYNIFTNQLTTTKLFDGEVASKSSSYSNGEVSITLELMSRANILSRIKIPYQVNHESLQTYIRQVLEQSGLTNYLGLKFSMDNDMLGKFTPIGKLIDDLKTIREKYAVFVFEDEANNLVVATPDFLRGNVASITKYNIDVKNYPVNVTINNTFSDINAILALGFTTKEDKTTLFGIAFDPLNYRINGGKLNYRIEYAYHITGGKNMLSKYALNLLMDECKQYKITVDNIPFENRFEIGKMITIQNHPEINPEQLFMIEEIEESISNTDSKITLVLSGFALGLVPEDILKLSDNEKAFGALDPDVNIALKSLRPIKT